MAGTIDELNFKVILDDAEFDAKVKNDIKLAKELNISLSSLLDIQKKVGRFTQEDVNNNRKANQILKDNARAQEAITREKIKTEGVQKKINAQIERATKGYQSQSRILNELKGIAVGYLSVHGASQLLSSLVRVTGEFELQKTTLAAMLGDLNQAEGIITRIQGLAVESPFQFKELTTYAKQLSAFSVPAQELYDTTKMLADVSAGLGVGMDRIVLAYGQVRSAAFLRGQEVRQFTEAGIPILDELAKQFSELEGRAVSTGEVFDKISARLVPFEMVAKVFKDMTSEGGKFYNMQEVQAETLRGKLSNLKDAYEVMLNEIGKGQSENLKGAVDWLRGLMQNYEDVGKSLLHLVAAYGAYKVALVSLEVLTGAFATTNHKLISSFVSIGRWVAKNPYALLAAGIGSMVGLIYKAATEQTSFEKSLDITNKTIQNFNKNVDAEKDLLKYLLDRLGKLTVGTSEYNDVKSQILKDYGQYLSDIDKENLAVGNLAGMYDKLTESIVESNRQKALSEGNAKLTQQFTTEYDAIFSKFDDTIKALGIENKAIRTALSDFVRGDIGLEELPQEALQAVKDAQARINAAALAKGGMFGSGVTFAGYDFEKLKEDLSSVEEVIADARENLSEDLRVIFGPMPQPKDAEKETRAWVKTVQDTLEEMGLEKGTSFGLWADDTTESTKYVDDMVKRYKELGEEIKLVSTFDEAQAARLKQNKDAIEEVAKALKIDLASLSESKKRKTKPQAQIDIETQIDLVKKLQDAYDKLRPYLDDTQMKSALGSLFPAAKKELLESFDFTDALEKLADDITKYDKEAGSKLRASIGRDMSQSVADAFKELEQYKKMLDSWLGEDFNLEGSGVSFDMSKILRDLNNQYAQIDQKRKNALKLLSQAQMGEEESLKVVREAYGEETWQKYLVEGTRVIDELTRKEKAAARQVADEKIRDLSSKYVKDLISSKNIDLSDMGDKSIAQIQTQIERLIAARREVDRRVNELNNFEPGTLTENQQSELEMLNKVSGELGLKIEDLGQALQEKLTDRALESADAVASLGSQISSLGESIDNAGIAEFGKEIEFAANGISSIINAAQNGGVVGAIAAVLDIVVSRVTDMISSAYEYQQRLNESAREYYETMLQIRREAYTGIFGTDEMGLATENARILAEETKNYQDAVNSFEDVKFRKQKMGKGQTFFGKMSVADIMQDISQEQGWDLYLANGELNIDAMEAYYDAYSDRLTKKQKDLVSDLIEQGRNMTDAAAQQAEYLTSIFSNVADTIADDMVAAFIESGDAAIDMKSVVSDVASDMASDLIKSLYIMPILNDYAEQLQSISANDQLSADEKTEAALGIFQTAVDEIEGNKDAINATLERLDEYFQHPEDSATSDLGQGIKGITEDQANLLASYLNAIRADVSYSKTLWERMDVNLQRIAEMFASSPTLMEYQAQIAANTYDTAQATQAILAELRSVVTTDSGDSAIRVYS